SFCRIASYSNMCREGSMGIHLVFVFAKGGGKRRGAGIPRGESHARQNAKRPRQKLPRSPKTSETASAEDARHLLRPWGPRAGLAAETAYNKHTARQGRCAGRE